MFSPSVYRLSTDHLVVVEYSLSFFFVYQTVLVSGTDTSVVPPIVSICLLLLIYWSVLLCKETPMVVPCLLLVLGPREKRVVTLRDFRVLESAIRPLILTLTFLGLKLVERDFFIRFISSVKQNLVVLVQKTKVGFSPYFIYDLK